MKCYTLVLYLVEMLLSLACFSLPYDLPAGQNKTPLIQLKENSALQINHRLGLDPSTSSAQCQPA